MILVVIAHPLPLLKQSAIGSNILSWQFLERQPQAWGILIFGRAFTLVQHILELFLGPAPKSNELESKSITILPSDDGTGDDNQGPSLRSLYTEPQTGSDGELDMTLDFTSGNREIGHRSMA
jgi:hypothetical protein